MYEWVRFIIYPNAFRVKKNIKKFIYFKSFTEDVCIKNTTCCFITKKLDDSIVSIGVVKLKSISNNDSPKKKKNTQKDTNMYEVNRDVKAVNWYLCLKVRYH